MARRFEVVGDVLGDEEVEGEGEEQEVVVGYTDDGEAIVVSGKRRRRRRNPRQSSVQLTRPQWRDTQLAPGVIAPDEGLLPLPMGTFTFALAAQTNTFIGQLQKPFKGERVLVTTVRTGTSAVGRLLGLIFVGTDLAQLDTTAIDLEQIGALTAFGVRLSMKPAQPGVQIKILTTLSSALAGADTIQATVQILGRNVG